MIDESKKLVFYLCALGLLSALLLIFRLYRRMLFAKYQLGAHLMAGGMLVAILSAAGAAFFDNVLIGARIAAIGFVVSFVGYCLQILHREK